MHAHKIREGRLPGMKMPDIYWIFQFFICVKYCQMGKNGLLLTLKWWKVVANGRKW